jgi:FkbM family methyltransferase
MEPTMYVAPPLPKPIGHWFKRGLTALIVEHRLPYQVSVVLDKFCNAVGLRRKTIKTDGLTVRVRRLSSDEHFVQNIIVNHEYTPPGFVIRESDIVVDIGGNIGTFALFASRCAPKGKVFTIEPNSENFELLLQNIALNQIDNIVPTRAAVSGNQGKVKLFSSTEGGFHSLLEDRMHDPARYEVVDSVTLKDIFDQYRIERCNFLKVDCEGAEYEIFYNLPAEYYSRIDKIAMEYHGDKDQEKRRAQSDALVSHLEKAGFRINTYQEFIGFRGGYIRATSLKL